MNINTFLSGNAPRSHSLANIIFSRLVIKLIVFVTVYLLLYEIFSIYFFMFNKTEV